MDLLNLMINRRSIRRYTADSIKDEDLNTILQAGLLSPTGRGRQPWEFVVVKDREKLHALSGCREGAANMLNEAYCAVVVLGNRNVSDTIIEDCSIAISYMQLMAASLGIGSCWIQGRLRTAADGTSSEEYVRKLLGFSEDYQLEAVLSIGRPQTLGKPHDLEKLPLDKIHYERF